MFDKFAPDAMKARHFETGNIETLELNFEAVFWLAHRFGYGECYYEKESGESVDLADYDFFEAIV